jgi:hypothetical protein
MQNDLLVKHVNIHLERLASPELVKVPKDNPGLHIAAGFFIRMVRIAL